MIHRFLPRSPGLVFAALMLVAGLVFSEARAQQRNPTVVELFTSQGCSSCPPADAFLGELAERDDLIALSFHIDYWDYIGWKDTFATSDTTARQHAYGRTLSQRYVYTPQMVIGGRSHVVGSQRHAVLAAIDSMGGGGADVHLATSPNGGLRIKIAPGQVSPPADVWLMEYDRRHQVAIRRGENRGRTISYHNVVRGLTKLGRWDGSATELKSDIVASRAGGRDGCVVIVQEANGGPILGAVRLKFGQ
ncbi:MAG: DUF1223 domain-containing protein [Alphaproteobacteria bacterium]|jgi:hypothetical protein|nr:DUF1223 domain-containing protein [Rhodospirillaceae bacterium]MDP6405523.1 DUF1223 domain-containing protein [Alphaproteobacteria bacterium]MDP6622341.1 DUF1223 domain-containing protein [Alphaproteobacteria bacterium]|tara:strand:- start:265 stop:1008 length:744 start_codon:yes stop_codon:yes gene_type:complete